VLQCIVVRCRVLQCIAVSFSVLPCVANVLQCVAVCCSETLSHKAHTKYDSDAHEHPMCTLGCNVKQCVAVLCSALQCVTVCCSEL